MASPLVVSVDWGDVVTTTLENRSKTIADNITNNNALLSRLRKKGKEKTFSGGREIMQELRYAQNQTFMWYSGYEFLNISLNDTMTAARFPIKQASIAVTISGLEELQNASVEQMKDLIEERVDTAEDTFWNQMSAGIYSDGTGFGGKQINGLAAAVSLTPTVGIYGGLDRSVQTWWRNLATNYGSLPTSTTIQAAMNLMAVNLKRNSDGADLIVADNNYYLAYLGSLQAIQRVVSDGSKGDVGAGFTALKYFGAGKEVDVVLDGGRNGQIRTIGTTNGTMLFLNTDYLFFRPHSGRNFKVIGGDRVNVNQDAKVRIMAWAGNITCNNASLQGVLYN
jgi:hypothetical protein